MPRVIISGKQDMLSIPAQLCTESKMFGVTDSLKYTIEFTFLELFLL